MLEERVLEVRGCVAGEGAGGGRVCCRRGCWRWEGVLEERVLEVGRCVGGGRVCWNLEVGVVTGGKLVREFIKLPSACYGWLVVACVMCLPSITGAAAAWPGHESNWACVQLGMWTACNVCVQHLIHSMG